MNKTEMIPTIIAHLNELQSEGKKRELLTKDATFDYVSNRYDISKCTLNKWDSEVSEFNKAVDYFARMNAFWKLQEIDSI